MMDNITLGRYYPGDSPLHRMDPRLKILVAILTMTAVFLIRKPVAIAVLTAGIGGGIALSRIPLRQVLRSVRPILFVILFAFFLNLFTVPGNELVRLGPVRITDASVEIAIRMALRLVLLIVSTSVILTLTTTPILIADALESLLKPLERLRFPVHELAMMMSIALRFVPTLSEETAKIMKAQSSRGADYDTGGVIQKARGLVSVLVPLFISAFRRAEDLAVAMEARCYRGGKGRTKLKVMRLTRLDAWAAVVFVLFIAVLCFLQFASLNP
jgi:energy-coupling factor transport system permease protein